LLLLAASPVGAHDDDTLDPHNATPGLRLEMIELPRASRSATTRYRLHAVGFPSGVAFSLWAQDFGQPFRLLGSGFQVAQSGNLVSSKHANTARSSPKPLTFAPGRYPRGAAWRLALVSADRAFRAFAGAIPHPITARDGPCTLGLELVSYRGDHFVATGGGFAPDDEVVAESRYAGRVTRNRQRVSAEGALPLSVISHQAIGSNRRARYVVTGRSCEVAVEYNWGAPALLRR
jgi:hypothetical protein